MALHTPKLLRLGVQVLSKVQVGGWGQGGSGQKQLPGQVDLHRSNLAAVLHISM